MTIKTVQGSEYFHLYDTDVDQKTLGSTHFRFVFFAPI
jgi:hypothetical protein